jgi:hypothetical protein
MNNTIDTTGTADNSGAEITGSEQYQGAEVTTMTTQATTEQTPATTTPAAAPKPKKAKKEPRNYPFLTKAQISAQIEGSFSFACEVIGILYDRQTKHEQDTSSTLNKNRRGFMSSHAVHGSRIAKDLRAGVAPEALSDEDKARVSEIAPRYTKQLAAHFRDAAIEANPELAAQAACFFTDQG